MQEYRVTTRDLRDNCERAIFLIDDMQRALRIAKKEWTLFSSEEVEKLSGHLEEAFQSVEKYVFDNVWYMLVNVEELFDAYDEIIADAIKEAEEIRRQSERNIHEGDQPLRLQLTQYADIEARFRKALHEIDCMNFTVSGKELVK